MRDVTLESRGSQGARARDKCTRGCKCKFHGSAPEEMRRGRLMAGIAFTEDRFDATRTAWKRAIKFVCSSVPPSSLLARLGSRTPLYPYLYFFFLLSRRARVCLRVPPPPPRSCSRGCGRRGVGVVVLRNFMRGGTPSQQNSSWWFLSLRGSSVSLSFHSSFARRTLSALKVINNDGTGAYF